MRAGSRPACEEDSQSPDKMRPVPWIRPAFAFLFTLVVAAVVIATRPLGAQGPAPAWDGFERLLAAAEGAEVELVHVNKLSLADVSARDALLIVGPHKQLPVTALSAFLREGGRIALLDDFGSGGRFLA